MKLALVYARSRNYCIGRDGNLPWSLPAEFAFFERTTRGHPVIMGRRTYEDHESALEDRLNIVISRSRSDFAPGVRHVQDLDAAIALAAASASRAFVIGGAGLMERAFDRADEVFESVVHAEIDGDVFIKPFDFSTWQTEIVNRHGTDDRHAFSFESRIHRRRG